MSLSNKPFYSKNIDEETKSNDLYRKVIYTNENAQLTLQCLFPGEDIPFERHSLTKQSFKFIEGEGEVVFYDPDSDEKDSKRVSEDSYVIVPPKTWHYVRNTSKDKPLKFYADYSRVVHNPKLIIVRQNSIYKLNGNNFLFKDKKENDKWFIFNGSGEKIVQSGFENCSEAFFSKPNFFKKSQ